MAKKRLELTSRAPIGVYKKHLISEIVENKDKKEIFSFIREGYDVSDEVLEAVGIKKYVGEKKAKSVIVDHVKDDAVYDKDIVSVKKVLTEISTLDNEESPESETERKEKEKNDTGYDTYAEFN